MNYFVEGLQGSGKSTLVERLSKIYPDHTVVHEGDYSPVELSWCAYVGMEKYREILEKYKEISQIIDENSHFENDHMIICYTKVITDIPGFHKDLEKYEIYNGRRRYEDFKRIVFDRYKKWNGSNMIFECSIFQNIIEDMILYRDFSDQEIMDFYKEIKDVLRGKDYRIIYLHAKNIEENLKVIRKERSDENGKEMWFPLMLGFFNESPYAMKRGISGEEELLKHFSNRQELEIRICTELFHDRATILESKAYTLSQNTFLGVF